MSEEDKEKDKVLLDEAAVASLVDKAVAAAVEAAITKMNDAKKEQEPKVEDEKINWKIADRVFSSEVGVAIKDRKDIDPASCIGEENTLPLKNLEDVKVAKTLPEILGLSDALKAKFLSLVDTREKIIKEDQMTLLKDVQRDYEASLRIIDEQKARITALEEEISNLKTKSVDNTKDEDENKTKMKDFGNVHNPSESSTPALDGKGTKLEDKLDTYTKNIVTRYKQILDSSGDKAASVYIRNLKSARYIPNNFNIDLYMEKE